MTKVNDTNITIDIQGQIFLDDLTSYRVTIRKQNFYIPSNENPRPIGDPWRTALQNDLYGRKEILNVIDEPYLSTVMTLWGNVPLINNEILTQATSPKEQLTSAKQNKIQELERIGAKAIDSGVDIETSQGIKHFSLTREDQFNLMNSKAEVMSAIAGFPSSVNLEQGVWYHADGEEYKFWSKEDFLLIASTAFVFVSEQLTYFNLLKTYVESLETIEDIAKVQYGMDIPKEV